MAVPLNWSVSTKLDTPVFFYSPPSSAVGFVQASIPKGGAVITVAAHDTVSGQARRATTPLEWAIEETRASSPEAPLVVPFEMPAASAVSRAVTSAYDEEAFSPDQQTQRSIAVFWEFHHELFAAHLNYVANDPNASTLRTVFLDTLRSLRPIVVEHH